MFEWLKKWSEGAAAPDALSENVPLSTLTSFRVGGPARFVARPGSAEELAELLQAARAENFPYVVLGRGSNVLASDEGYGGLVVLLSGFDRIEAEGEILRAGAGVLMGTLAQAALEAGLSGLEFASGIPGTLGGGLFMNAGAYGGELCQVVESVDVLLPDGTVRTLSNEEMAFSYRRSVLQTKPWLALSAVIRLRAGDREEIRAAMRDLSARRRDKQPLEFPSAGSTFKRPEGNFAGALIEQASLKGVRIGGAQVSDKHAGFIVNTGGASSRDVQELVRYVQEQVEKRSGILLEPEVRFLGPDGLGELK